MGSSKNSKGDELEEVVDGISDKGDSISDQMRVVLQRTGWAVIALLFFSFTIGPAMRGALAADHDPPTGMPTIKAQSEKDQPTGTRLPQLVKLRQGQN